MLIDFEYCVYIMITKHACRFATTKQTMLKQVV